MQNLLKVQISLYLILFQQIKKISLAFPGHIMLGHKIPMEFIYHKFVVTQIFKKLGYLCQDMDG